MKKYIHLIRHGKTTANEKMLYCGQTDVDLSENGQQEIKELVNSGIYPKCDIYFVSGLKRAKQTMGIIFGEVSHTSFEFLNEYNFGVFEMKTYEENKTHEEYQKWVDDTTGTYVCPGGESLEIFTKRVTEGFREIMEKHSGDAENIAIVAHGGSIARIMEHLFIGERNYYEWLPKNGQGYTVTVEDGKVIEYKGLPEKNGEKFCMSLSCGKDSMLALHKMVKEGNTPVALIVNINKEHEVSWFHGVSVPIINRVAESLNIPVIFSGGDDYGKAFVEAMKKAKEMGATVCAFGDIDIFEHRQWSLERSNEAGLSAVFPLWNKKRLDIVNEFIDTGYSAIIKAISKEYGLSKDYLGKKLTKELVNEFEVMGIDACGENGEYHTFCFDGPLFTKPISFEFDGIYENEFGYSIILKLDIGE